VEVCTLFKAKMTDAKLLRDTITAISTLMDEATFDVNPDGIKLRAMDPSRVAMVDFEWSKTVFDEYVCDKPTKICINVSEMLKLLRRAERDESIELSLDEKTGRLRIVVMGNYVRTFNMPTLEATEEEAPTPKLTFNVRAKTTTEGLRRAVEDVSLVSDHVQFEVDGEKVVMRATGDLMGALVELKKGSDALLDLEVKEQAKATFSLSYLSEIIKAASATSDVATVEFSTDMPIRLDFQQQKEGKLVYYLAPRIEVE